MYFVSRQQYWPDGDFFVEVVSGGMDYANADMLVSRYPGEGEEYEDPRKAVDVAIQIRNRWQADCPEEEINLGCGATGGFTIPMSACNDDEAETWAEKIYEKLKKCEECGEILGKTKFTHTLACFEQEFCSEYCSEKNYMRCTED